MTGTQMRTAALTRGDDGRSAIIAFDHGGNGVLPGGEDSKGMIQLLAASDADGILIGPGLMRPLSALLARPGAPRMVVGIDGGTYGPMPGVDKPLSNHRLLISPEYALSYGATAVKMLLPLGMGDRELLANATSLIARTAAECDTLGLPLMLEPAFWGKDIDDVSDEMIAHATRMSIELGAHILKIPAPTTPGALEQIIDGTDLPVYLLGGVPGDGEAFGRALVDWIVAGATGVAVGRSVWSRPNVDHAINGVITAVHSKDADKAAELFRAAG